MPAPPWLPKKANLVARELDDELILHNPNSGIVVCLNLVAGLVWDLCDGSRDVPAITAAPATMFDKLLGNVAQDVQTILREFAEKGFVQ